MKKVVVFMRKNKQFMILVLLAAALVLIALFARKIVPYSPYESNLKEAFLSPSASHWFGTDKLGRDVLSRVIYGLRISLTASLALVSIIFLVGTIFGTISGFYGGMIDSVIMRFSDMMISFPGMVLAIAVAGIIGASIANAIIAIAAVSWTKYARLARSLVLKIRHKDYIYAAQTMGTKDIDILRYYLIPNALPTLIITAATDIGTMILELAGLSFLGFGAQAPLAEWGLMLNEGRAYMFDCPWLMVFPGMAICVVAVIFNLLGDCLRDILDPKQI
ncbi:nickel transporter permease [Sinanaerobacter sp. ZZT-01]|uniref:nickel transporter permease n=1 Tax=Sinanaerobacter sp. ZZT-01 TaxID=3111540 RepID=UPI002D793FBE|nr:nickel transporter permease [Sinanaerobacter sp. ZZT-01]WRR93436.1 nickel transporter permease [Sinanaerobacter sp. ZZT-01]